METIEKTIGQVFDIQRFSLHDGPGIRTTVFLKGCPLRCLWCHNPESNLREPQLSFTESRCIGCGACFKACTHGGHVLQDGAHLLTRENCIACGDCARSCYAEALEIVGKPMSAQEVMDEVVKDLEFYKTSGGGMTISGGEPLFQPEFSLALLKLARTKGISTGIETSGFASWDILEQFVPLVDSFMFDIKETDTERHKQVTGVPFEPIRDNLLRLDERGVQVLVRLPLVPGVNAIEEHFRGIGELAKRLHHVKGFEIMPYHRLGEGKMERLGLAGKLKRVVAEAPSKEEVQTWRDALLNEGVETI